jgi:hypothetical protein
LFSGHISLLGVRYHVSPCENCVNKNRGANRNVSSGCCALLYSTWGITNSARDIGKKGKGKNPFLLMKTGEVVTIVASLSVNTIPAQE